MISLMIIILKIYKNCKNLINEMSTQIQRVVKKIMNKIMNKMINKKEIVNNIEIKIIYYIDIYIYFIIIKIYYLKYIIFYNIKN
jgi:hypothetical protein